MDEQRIASGFPHSALRFYGRPIIAGLDKFLHLLTDWDKYLTPAVSNTL
jgi:hypothetical protein